MKNRYRHPLLSQVDLLKEVQCSHRHSWLSPTEDEETVGRRKEVVALGRAGGSIEDLGMLLGLRRVLCPLDRSTIVTQFASMVVQSSSKPLKIVTFLCPIPNPQRTDIAKPSDLDHERINELVNTMRLMFSGISRRIDSWVFYIYDSQVLDTPVETMIFPGIRGRSDAQQRLDHNFTMSQEQVVARLEAALDFPVEARPMIEAIGKAPATIEALQAQGLLDDPVAKILANPPASYSLLQPKQREALARTDVGVYLHTTKIFGDGTWFNLALEVHDGYWRAGRLWQLNDHFLPVLFAPDRLRGHWTEWFTQERRLRARRKALLWSD